MDFSSTRTRRIKSLRRPVARQLLVEPLETRSLLATFTVSSLADSGAGSLRQAITNANNAAGLDTITFGVTGTIKPTSELPGISDATIIDGGSAPNFTGKPKVAIDGSLAGSASGLAIKGGGGTTIKGLSIHSFDGGLYSAGILVASGDNTITGNFLGVDLNGTAAKPNTYGVLLAPITNYAYVDNNVIGGNTAGERNIISGNSSDGVAILGGFDTQVLGNYIGLDVTGTASIPNGKHGVVIDSFSPFVYSAVPFSAGSGNIIGTTTSGEGNRIRSNGGAGVVILDGIENSIRGNSIHGNGALGIDLSGNGITQNDKKDPDSGSNFLQNHPLVGGLGTTSTSISMAGVLMSFPDTTYQIDLYASPSGDPSGNGEGYRFLGSTITTTDSEGLGYWSRTVNTSVAAGWVISSTATDPTGNTSEFSNTIVVPAPGAPATLKFFETTPRVAENSGVAELLVTRTGNLSVVSKVNFATAPDTAKVHSDYASQLGTLTFNAGQAVALVRVPIVNDQLTEGLERFDVTLSNPVNAALSGNNPAEVVIVDDDVLDLTFSTDGKDLRNTTGPVNDWIVATAQQSDGKYVAVGQSGGDQYNIGGAVTMARYAANGNLDTTFGGQGKVTLPLSALSKAFDVEVLSNGKILVLANTETEPYGDDTILARYNANGTLDTTFGTDGLLIIDFSSDWSYEDPVALEVQNDGKFLVAVATENTTIVARYLADGTADTSFDGDGVKRYNFESADPYDYDHTVDMEIDANGKIVVLSEMHQAGDPAVGVLRLNTNGSLDTSFNGSGVHYLSNYPFYAANDLAIGPTGKVVVVGQGQDENYNYFLSVVQFNTNGTLDNTFSGDGKLTDANFDDGVAVTVQSNGKLIISSVDEIVRYNADGAVDTTFSGDGKLDINVNVNNLAIDAAGKLIAAGGGVDYIIGRVNLSTAALDTTFSGDGKQFTGFIADWDDTAKDVITQPDGKILVLGQRTPPGEYDNSSVLYRYNVNGTLDSTFGSGGRAIFTQFAAGKIVLQDDGKILLGSGGTLARLNTNGSLDTTFSEDGMTSPGGAEVLVQSDGTILTVTSNSYYDYTLGRTIYEIVLYRFDADGSFDSSFSGETGFEGTAGRAMLDGSGKVLVLASNLNRDPETLAYFHEAKVVRLNADGTPDTTFNGTGERVFRVQDDDQISSLLGIDLLSTGQIIAGWEENVNSSLTIRIAKLSATGGLIGAFGNGGVLTADIGKGAPRGAEMMVDSQNRIVTAGSTILYDGNGLEFEQFVARYLPTGVLDETFGGSGIVFYSHGPGDGSTAALTEDSAKNLIVVGTSGSDTDIAVARFRTTITPGPFATMAIAAGSYSVNEADGTIAITVKRTGSTANSASVSWSIAGSTATKGIDFTGNGGRITFAAGQSTKTINIAITNDLIDEANERFSVSINNPSGAYQIGPAQTTSVTIVDDDPAPAIAVNNVSVTEGNSGTKSLIFLVTLSRPSSSSVTVDFKTTNGTAIAPGDYTAKALTKLTFLPGQTSKQVIVTIKGDTAAEAKEQFFLDLSNPTKATIADSRGVGTITNDDVASMHSASDEYFAGLYEDDMSRKRKRG